MADLLIEPGAGPDRRGLVIAPAKHAASDPRQFHDSAIGVLAWGGYGGGLVSSGTDGWRLSQLGPRTRHPRLDPSRITRLIS
jgi:hypothetical protein